MKPRDDYWLGFLPPLIVVGTVAIVMLTGCTLARYSGPEHSLTVIDIHPTGNTVALDAALNDKGRVRLNREQGGTEGLVEEVGDIVRPGLLP